MKSGQIAIGARPGIHPDAPGIMLRDIANLLQHFPGAFQKETILGVQDFRFSRVETKKRSIKLLNICQNR